MSGVCITRRAEATEELLLPAEEKLNCSSSSRGTSVLILAILLKINGDFRSVGEDD